MSYESRSRCKERQITPCGICPLMFKCPYDEDEDEYNRKKVKRMAQKYIIGDLVKVSLEDKEQVVSVIGYDPTYKRYLLTNEYIDKTRGCIFATENEILPISLTPESIEKNGWEFVGGQLDEDGFTWDIYSNGDVLPDLYYYPDGKFSVFMYRKEILPDIKYIHQLQHFLFGLGLNSEMEV